MSVFDILTAKGRDVLTVGESETIADVAKILAEKRIGAVIVLNAKGKPSGITSERDIVRQIAEGGAKALEQPVAQCMTSNVKFCSETDTIDQAMEQMTEGRFRHLPVMRDGELSGIISIGDVVKRKIDEVVRDAEDLKQYIAS